MEIDPTALAPLAPLVGEWDMETSLAPAGAVRARATFEWPLGGQFLVQRTEIEHPDAPDALSMIAAMPTGAASPSTTSTPEASCASTP